MARRFGLIMLFVVMALAAWASPVQADGIIVPDICRDPGCNPPPPPCVQGKACPPIPPHRMFQLSVRNHRVTVKIDRQVAVTHVDQVFYNPNTWTVEGTYIFPLPLDAVVGKFTLWVDGKPVDGKVLSAQEARSYYENIVREQRDPALLEYVGRGAVQARVFPIAPKGERRIELEYSQVLSAENGLVRYIYPLNTEKFSKTNLENVSVSVEIHSDQPLRAVYSSSHPISTDRNDNYSAVAGWEAKNVRPDKDFILYYSLGESNALHLLTFRDPKDPIDTDGYFLLLLAPQVEAPERQVSKDVILVLDRSGSMEGEKFRQAQAALKYVLQHLSSDDRFGLLTFSTSVQPYARGLRPADEAGEAAAWVDRLGASGSTDINRALLDAAAMADKERPTFLIFLTDGLPTVGETNRDRIMTNFSTAASKNIRLFTFGVGYDVDTILLDTLSQQQHGLSSYVKPGEKVDEVLSTFYERISTPVLTDLALDFGKMGVYDLYPSPLPDLFAGNQVIVAGRYRQGGQTNLTLKGTVNGQAQSIVFEGLNFATDSREAGPELASLPRLWATRKVGTLLNQIRLKGPDKETVDQIVKLSIRYGIVTPYTSYLVTEDMPLGVENQERVAKDALKSLQAAPQAPSSGAGAVQRAAEQGALSQADQAPVMSEDDAQRVMAVGARTFVNQQGVWTDTVFDPKSMKTVKVAFLSADYFKLSQSRADVAAGLALGEKVIVVVDGTAYEVVAETTGVPTLQGVTTPQPKATATPGATQAATLKPEVITTHSAVQTLESTRPTRSRSFPEPGEWLPLAALGLGVLVVFGISLLIWVRRKD